MTDAASDDAPASTPRAKQRTAEDLAQPAYRQGLIALLGVLAYGELVGFLTIAQEAGFPPSSRDKTTLAKVATQEFAHYERLEGRLRELGADPHQAMAPFTRAIDDWHRRATPTDWSVVETPTIVNWVPPRKSMPRVRPLVSRMTIEASASTPTMENQRPRRATIG